MSKRKWAQNGTFVTFKKLSEISYMPTSVNRMAGQSFKFGWTHINSAGHNTFIERIA